jgi:hypothetical protein
LKQELGYRTIVGNKMLKRLEYLCLVACIGLIGADRIDFLLGNAPFTLTPFLILAPLILFLHLLRVGPHRLFRPAITPAIRRQFPFLAAWGGFILLTFVSIPVGLDPERGLVAFSDLLLVGVLGYYISVRIVTEPARAKLVVRSVTFALVIYVFFCIAECIAFSRGIVLIGPRSGSWLEYTFAPSTLAFWAPCLSGTTYDSNRSGFILMMYLVLVDKFAVKSRFTHALHYIIAVFVFLTLSRSGVLCWLAYYLFSNSFWKSLASRRVIVRLAAIVIVTLLLYAKYQEQVSNLLEVYEVSDYLSAKVSMDRGTSGESHILLIERGFETWLTSSKTIIAGIGFAAAPKVLQDFFGTDKHGNFHSIYVSTLAEVGLPAFLVLMIIFGGPVVARKGAVASMAAIMVFNVSYQTIMEPMFWCILAFLWSYERRQRPTLRSLALTGEYRSIAITATSES